MGSYINIVRFTYTVLLLASVICSILLIKYSYKRRTMPGAKYFILLLYFGIIYNFGYIGEINSNTFLSAMFWFSFEHIAIPFQHYFWFMMGLEFVGVQKKKLTLAKYGLLYHPILCLIIFYTNPMHHLYASKFYFLSNGYFKVIIFSKGILYMTMIVSGTILALMTTFFYIRGFAKSSSVHRYAYVIMIIASLIPWISNYFYITNTSYLGVDYFPVVSSISCIVYMFGIFKFRMFNTIPIATEIVFKQAKEGILLIDIEDHIIDANDAFVRIYPELKELSRKQTLMPFMEAHSEFDGFLKGDYKSSYQLLINGMVKHYSAEITKILTDEEFQIGKILTITDITLFVEHEKSLKLVASNALEKAEINEIAFLQAQIKPHFFNNTLSTIASMITMDPDAARELVVNFSEYLMRAYLLEDTSGMTMLSNELDAVNTYVTIEKARFRERLNFKIICEDIPKIKIPRLVLQPLVENAIRHGVLKKAEGGTVNLKISRDENKIYFEVSDDGIGMPEYYKNQGIGMLNIHKRLVKYYGEGLKVSSRINVGTTVSFFITYSKEGVENNK